MEEQVGVLWHRLITRLGARRYPAAGVELDAVARTLGICFRAFGGDPGLTIRTADATAHGARRGLLARISGSDDKVTLAWRDERALLLPQRIEAFPEPALNRDLYFWLAALAASSAEPQDDWLRGNQRLTRTALERFPGLAARYRRLVAAHCAERPDTDRLPADEAAVERLIRQALAEPGSVAALPAARRPPSPVLLWLHPDPPLPLGAALGAGADSEPEPERAGQTADLGRRRRRGARVKLPEQGRGLVTIRMENILTFGEQIQIDRGTDEEDDLDRAAKAADDMEQIAVARDRRSNGARLRFDLDLPAASEDDLILADGERLPEWDWKAQCLLPDHCRIQEMLAADAPPRALPAHLRRSARRLRAQFQLLAPARTWLRRRPDGQDLDLDAYLRFAADRHAGAAGDPGRLYREQRSGARDLACLLLADLSLSTDTWIDDHGRVIDAIRDSLFLFGESLAATGDRFAMLGFSSRRRDPVRVHRLKDFEEGYGAQVRGRIAAIRPGYYTRLGAGIRHAAGRLSGEGASRRLLLILTDGKPNDLDRYEGRWGIEDTRHAVQEARRKGLEPFCVTIDPRGNDYLPHLFGNGGYVVIRRAAELPARLPLLYARLTA
jgi:nitric oxide reductase NorD protein